MSGVGRVACQGFLVREARVSVLGGCGWISSLECSDVSSREFWGVCGLGVTFSRLYINAQGHVPVLLEN